MGTRPGHRKPLRVAARNVARALSDKFADVRVLQRALMEKGRSILLDQRTKAESDYAVAAASILAREKFIDWLDAAGKRRGRSPSPRRLGRGQGGREKDRRKRRARRLWLPWPKCTSRPPPKSLAPSDDSASRYGQKPRLTARAIRN